jgi:uridine phosphorylase
LIGNQNGYLRPTAAIAPDALLVADPGLAMTLAQAILDKPLMANHHHGLWGYSGITAAGQPLTVQSMGIGGPSTAAVALELAAFGVVRAIRVGQCTALASPPAAGSVVVVERALGRDGTSSALGVPLGAPDPQLRAALAAAVGGAAVTVVGYDLAVAAAPAGLRAEWLDAGANVADGETAAFLAAGKGGEVAVAAALLVEPASTEELVALGERAALALAGEAQLG